MPGYNCYMPITCYLVPLQVKYVGDDGEEQNGLQMMGLNLMDKTMTIRGARIASSGYANMNGCYFW